MLLVTAAARVVFFRIGFCCVCELVVCVVVCFVFCFQAEDGIRDLVRSRGLGDVYKRQGHGRPFSLPMLASSGHP